MNLKFKTILLVGKLSGSFPISCEQLLKTVQCRTHKVIAASNWILFYSLIILIVYPIFEIYDLVTTKYPLISKMKLSKAIMIYTINVDRLFTCVSLRAWSLYRCQDYSNLLSRILNWGDTEISRSGSKVYRHYTSHILKFDLLVYTTLALDLIQWLYSNQSHFFHQILSSNNLAPAPLQIDPQNVNSLNSTPYTNSSKTTNNSIDSIQFFDELLYFFTKVIAQLIYILTRYFALAIVIFMGVQLLETFEDFCSDLQNLYCTQTLKFLEPPPDSSPSDPQRQKLVAPESRSRITETTLGGCGKELHKNQKQNQQSPQKIFTLNDKLTRMNAQVVALFDELDHSHKSVRILYPKYHKDKTEAEVVDVSNGQNLWATHQDDPKDNNFREEFLHEMEFKWENNPEYNTYNSRFEAKQKVGSKLYLKHLTSRFLEIQNCFDEYNKIAGLSCFILICHSTVDLLHKLFGAASGEFTLVSDDKPELAMFICKGILCFLVIGGLSHLGELFDTKRRKWNEQFNCIILLELLCNQPEIHESTNSLTESLMEWEWHLNAVNLFDVNHALVPAIAGTLMTYLIIIIQLRVSEITVNAVANNTTN